MSATAESEVAQIVWRWAPFTKLLPVNGRLVSGKLSGVPRYADGQAGHSFKGTSCHLLSVRDTLWQQHCSPLGLAGVLSVQPGFQTSGGISAALAEQLDLAFISR